MAPVILSINESDEVVRLQIRIGSGECRSRPFRAPDLKCLRDLATSYEHACTRHVETEFGVIGRALTKWFDGDNNWLELLLEHASTDLHLEVCGTVRERPDASLSDTERLAQHGIEVLQAAPWELLCTEEGFFLADDPLRDYTPLRRLQKGEITTRTPPPGPLTLVFMAAAPTPTPMLDYEAEEAAILEATRGHEVELFVEDTGTARDLALHLLQTSASRAVHALHLTCAGENVPAPRLILENERGYPAKTSAVELCNELGPSGRELGLLFLSAASSAATRRSFESPDPVAAALVRQGIPAVLGWAGPVRDDSATCFASALYAALSRGDTTLEIAVARARRAVLSRSELWRQDWHLSRLHLGSRGGGVVCGAAESRAQVQTSSLTFLDTSTSRVPVAGPAQFVGRRAALRACARALRRPSGAGILIHGLGTLGKSSLAARVSARMRGTHQLVVMHGRFRARELLHALAQTLDAGAGWAARRLARAEEELEFTLRELLDSRLHAERRPKQILMVLDEFEQLLERCHDGVHRVRAPYTSIVSAIVRAFADADSSSRIIITSRHEFELRDALGRELSCEFTPVPLASFTAAEIEKRVRRVADTSSELGRLCARCGEGSQGNPALLELLIKRAIEDPEGCARLLDRLRDEHPRRIGTDDEELHAFLIRVALDDLVETLDPGERRLLGISQGFEVPVPLALVPMLTDAPDARSHAERLIALGAWDESPDIGDPTRRAFAANRLISAWMRDALERPTPDQWRAAVSRVLPILSRFWSRIEGQFDEPAAARAGFELVRLGELAGATDLVWRFGHLALSWASRALEISAARELAARVVRLLDDSHQPPTAQLLRKAAELHEGGPEPDFHSQCLERALELADAWGVSDKDRAHITHDVAAMCIQQGHLSRAMVLLGEVVIPLYERLGARREYAISSGLVADILVRRGEPSRSLCIREHHELPVFRGLGETLDQARTLGKMAEVMIRRGELDRALRALESEVLPIFELLEDESGQAVALSMIAEAHAQRGRVDLALEIYEQRALPIHERLEDTREQTVVSLQIAELRHARGELDLALDLLSRVVPTLKELGDVREQAIALGMIAEIHRTRDELEEAFYILEQQVLPIFVQLQDRREQAIAWGQLADLHLAQGDPRAALAVHRERALPVFEELGDPRERAITLQRIASVLEELEEYEEAAEILDDELPLIFEGLGDMGARALVLEQLAGLLQEIGDLEEAQRVLRERALPTLRSPEHDRQRASCWVRLADICMEREQYEDARKILTEEVLFVLAPGEDLPEQAEAFEMLVYALVALDEVEEARRVLEQDVVPVLRTLGDDESIESLRALMLELSAP